jgi:subtilisin
MIRRFKSAVISALALSLAAWLPAAPAFAASSAALPPGVVRHIVVFKSGIERGARLSIVQGEGGQVVRELPLINAVVIQGDSSRILDAKAGLSRHSEVLRVDPDPVVNWLVSVDRGMGEFAAPSASEILGAAASALKTLKTAPQPAKPAGQKTPWGVSRVHAPEAWAKTAGQGVKVCVVDTGIDMTHPDLKGNIAGGWNALDNSSNFKDDNGHGTHVSGTIAAVNNAIGVVGVAPKASLYGVKVLDASGSGSFDAVIAGMQWCVQNHMQVASMSLGADQGNDSLKETVAAMAKGGVTLIAAAGNSGPGAGTVGYPAGYPGAIAIAAMDSSDKTADFSSRGPQVAFIAPGVNVLSTYMGGGYRSLSGTSMATPHMTGLAALAIAARGVSGYQSVLAALKSAATPISGVDAAEQGNGVVDARVLAGGSHAPRRR